MNQKIKKAYKTPEGLVSGDAQYLGDSLGFTADYVRKVLNGKRKNETIETAAAFMIRSRQQVKSDIGNISK